MIPRKYYHEDKEELAHYIDNSTLNERLFEGFLRVKTTYEGGPRVLHPLILFNEAYYYASKVCMDQYPELDINGEYLDDFMIHHPDELSRDIVFAFVYVILCAMQYPPKKAMRFRSLLYEKMGFENEYLSEILCAGNGRIRDIGYSDDHLCNGVIYDLFVDYSEIDWKEATDGFKPYYINQYISRAWDLSYQIDMIDAIKTQYLNLDPVTDDSFNTRTADFIRMKWTGLMSEKDSLKEENPEEFNKVFPKEKVEIPAAVEPVIEELPFTAPEDYSECPPPFDDLPFSVSPEESYPLEDSIYEDLTKKIKSLEKELEDAETSITERDAEIAELRKQNEDLLKPSDSEISAGRTRAVVSAVIFDLMKLAKGQRHGTNITQSKAAKIISYLTDFSDESIRQGLSKATLNSDNGEEIAQIIEAFKSIGIEIKID